MEIFLKEKLEDWKGCNVFWILKGVAVFSWVVVHYCSFVNCRKGPVVKLDELFKELRALKQRSNNKYTVCPQGIQ